MSLRVVYIRYSFCILKMVCNTIITPCFMLISLDNAVTFMNIPGISVLVFHIY